MNGRWSNARARSEIRAAFVCHHDHEERTQHVACPAAASTSSTLIFARAAALFAFTTLLPNGAAVGVPRLRSHMQRWLPRRRSTDARPSQADDGWLQEPKRVVARHIATPRADKMAAYGNAGRNHRRPARPRRPSRFLGFWFPRSDGARRWVQKLLFLATESPALNKVARAVNAS